MPENDKKRPDYASQISACIGVLILVGVVFWVWDYREKRADAEAAEAARTRASQIRQETEQILRAQDHRLKQLDR